MPFPGRALGPLIWDPYLGPLPEQVLNSNMKEPLESKIKLRLDWPRTPPKGVPNRVPNRGSRPLFGACFIAPPEAQITLTPVWESIVTMGLGAHIGDPYLGGTPAGRGLGYG